MRVQNSRSFVQRKLIAGLGLLVVGSSCVQLKPLAGAALTAATKSIAPRLEYRASTITKDLLQLVDEAPLIVAPGVQGCTITPALPAGLTFSSSTCAIQGTGTQVLAPTSFTVVLTASTGTAKAAFTLEVKDVAPKLTFPASVSFALNTSGTVSPSSNTGGAVTQCDLMSGSLPAGISLSNACVLSGTSGAAGTYAVSVRARNAIGSDSTQAFQVVVADAAPKISLAVQDYNFDIKSAATVPAVSNAGGAIQSCALKSGSPALPAGLSLNGKTCQISGTPTTPTANATYRLAATNAIGTDELDVRITVWNVKPSISYSSSSLGLTLKTAMSAFSPLSNNGGLVTSCTATGLPAGLSISSACVISGTPAEVVSAQVATVTPSNAEGAQSGIPISITVDTIAPQIAYSAAKYTLSYITAGTTGVPVSSGGGIDSCTLQSGSLPAGLSLNAKTCEISGTPTALTAVAGVSLTVKATNTKGNSTQAIVVVVQNIVPQVAYSAVSYVFPVGSTAGTGAVTNTGGTYANAGDSGCSTKATLPAGLALNKGNCEITGTPTSVQTPQDFEIAIGNSAGTQSVTLSIEIADIAPDFQFTPDTLTFTKGDKVSVAAKHMGGTPSKCESSVAMPDGVVLGNDCSLSGTADAVFSSTGMLLTASNSAGTADFKLTLEVVDTAPEIALPKNQTSILLEAATKQSFTFDNLGGEPTSCTATVGGSKYIQAASAIVSGKCVVDIAASEVETGTVEVVASNSQGSSPSVVLTVEAMALPAVDFSSFVPKPGLVFGVGKNASSGVPISTGGPITSCSVTPALSAGLSLSSSTCEISGKPTSTAAKTVYTVTPKNALGSGAGAAVTITVN